MNRTVGIVLIVFGVMTGFVGGAWLLSQLVSHGPSSLGGVILGFGLLLLVLVGPLIAGGVIALGRGQSEAQGSVKAAQLRKVLDIVQTRGAVKVSDLVLDLHSDLPSVQNMVYQLVGMGVFSGYVNWDDGVLYSLDAAGLRNLTECKKCGGQLTLAGKGVIKCPYCGTEYFVA